MKTQFILSIHSGKIINSEISKDISRIQKAKKQVNNLKETAILGYINELKGKGWEYVNHENKKKMLKILFNKD